MLCTVYSDRLVFLNLHSFISCRETLNCHFISQIINWVVTVISFAYKRYSHYLGFCLDFCYGESTPLLRWNESGRGDASCRNTSSRGFQAPIKFYDRHSGPLRQTTITAPEFGTRHIWRHSLPWNCSRALHEVGLQESD